VAQPLIELGNKAHLTLCHYPFFKLSIFHQFSQLAIASNFADFIGFYCGGHPAFKTCKCIYSITKKHFTEMC